MPAPGRHRRHRPSSVSRASLRVTAGGAGIALPLMGAQLVHAAPEDTWHKVAAKASAPRAAKAGSAEREQAAEAERAGRAERAKAKRSKQPTTYEVVGGDSLSSIARSQDVEGGWPKLYEHNRGTVGGDPDLILPGQRLQLDGSARQSKPQAEPEPTAKAKAKAKGKTETEAGSTAKAKPQPKPRSHPRKAEAHAAKPASSAVTAPVSGFHPSTGYRAAGGSWSSGHHTGVDFPVPTGTTVKAVSSGKVVSAGWANAYGYEVVLRHRDGKYSQYGHLSAISVRAGQTVTPGHRIGRSGATGNATGPHLHFEIRTGPGYGTDINPLTYMRRHGISL